MRIETKLNSVRLETVRRKLGFVDCLAANAIGRKEGLALLQKGALKVDIINLSHRHISTWMKGEDPSSKWMFIGFYVNPTPTRGICHWTY